MSQYTPGSIPEPIMEILRNKAPDQPIAIIGASNDPSKYGNIILRNLLGKGYKVIPVNPKETEIEGLPVVASVLDLPQETAILDFVIPPKITQKTLEALKGKGLDNIWLQDGSFDDEIAKFAELNFKTVVHHACIMVVTNFV